MNANNSFSTESIRRLIYGEPSEYQPFPRTGSEAENTNGQICVACGGKCCKMCGCHFSPDDFEERSFESLKNHLDQGYISIDLVFGEQYYLRRDNLILRIRNKDSDIYAVQLVGNTQECSLLTPTGCLLPYAERPRGGQALIPSENHRCHNQYSVKQCSLDWGHFQAVLHELASYYRQMEERQHYENQLVKRLTINKEIRSI
jgi:hypothetical protein